MTALTNTATGPIGLTRYAGAAGGAALITFGLFFLMHTLIAGSPFSLGQAKKIRIVDFVRLKRAETVEQKQRALPQRPRTSSPSGSTAPRPST